MIDLTGIDLSVVMSEITGMIPTVLPVIISFIAFRKGLNFLIGSLKGA